MQALGIDEKTMKYDDGDWKELRSMIGALANAIYLIAGGALTLSISVLLDLKQTTPILKSFACTISIAWYALLASIICFLVLKGLMIVQSFARGSMSSEKYNLILIYTNTLAWVLGVVGLTTFIIGMYKLVDVAIGVVYA